MIASDPAAVIGLERYVKLARAPAEFKPELFDEARFFDLRAGDTFYESLDGAPFESSKIGARERYPKAKVLGDKIPMLHPLFPVIKERFPGAKIVWIVRNIFDVAASFQRRAGNFDDAHWPQSRDFRAACEEWNGALKQCLLWHGKLSMTVIDYERFSAGLLDIGKLSDFLGLDRACLEGAYATELETGRRIGKPSSGGLSPLQIQHVATHADFESYRKVLGLAKSWSFAGWPAQVPGKPPTGPKYAKEDERVVDYQYHVFAGTWIRGPKPHAEPRNRIAFLGAASAFGRLSRNPYPQITASRLGMEALNLGYGGARASLYTTNIDLLAEINKCRLAVIEVFSARGTGTAMIETRDHGSAFLRHRGTAHQFEFADSFYEKLRRAWSQHDLRHVVEDIRQCYLEEMNALIDAIKIPKVLLWLSSRPAELPFSAENRDSFMGQFPHFVDRATLDALAAKCNLKVEVVSSAGLPEPIFDRETGEPVAIFAGQAEPSCNTYYPSQAMHDLAAEALIPELQTYCA